MPQSIPQVVPVIIYSFFLYLLEQINGWSKSQNPSSHFICPILLNSVSYLPAHFHCHHCFCSPLFYHTDRNSRCTTKLHTPCFCTMSCTFIIIVPAVGCLPPQTSFLPMPKLLTDMLTEQLLGNNRMNIECTALCCPSYLLPLAFIGEEKF